MNDALVSPLTMREVLLAGCLAVIAMLELSSFLLYGRVETRTHVGLSVLGLITAFFGLLALLGSLFGPSQSLAFPAVVCMLGLFKIMNQFELVKKAPQEKQKPPAGPSG